MLFFGRKHSLTTKYFGDSYATYNISAVLHSPSLPAMAGWHAACVSQHPDSFKASPERGMSSWARNQGGENQFTTDLFLTASQLWMKSWHSPWLEELMLPGQGRAWQLSHTSSTGPGSRDPGWDSIPVPDSIPSPAQKKRKRGSKAERTDALEYFSHHPALGNFPAMQCLHSLGTGGTGADLQLCGGVPPPSGLPHPPSPLATTQEQEGDGWEATGWQAGAVRQGKHGTGCNATDLEITLSYKRKKVQAGQTLPAGLAQLNPTAAEPRGTLGLSPDFSDQH